MSVFGARTTKGAKPVAPANFLLSDGDSLLTTEGAPS